MSLGLCALVAKPAAGQVETIESTAPSAVTWISQGQFEGHLALHYSPAGAFSPDGRTLAVVVEGKVVVMDFRGGPPRSLRPRVEGVGDLTIHSASFVAPDRILLLGNGVIRGKGKGPPQSTPTLAFTWHAVKDVLTGKVNALGESGGYAPPRYFPMIGYVGLFKQSIFDLWHPLTGMGGRVSVPSLTLQPNLFEFSPDGRWIILAQLEGSGGTDPIVVDMRTGAFADSLRGQQGTTLSVAFSRNNQLVVTACEDGIVRVWSVGGWKLLHPLAGHSGTVAWAEFSPDGKWIVSGGYDKTVRVWSAQDGSPLQTLTESKEPIRTVAFSPDGETIVASGEEMVWAWKAVKN